MIWILTALSIVGVVLNIRKNKACFIIWAGTNFTWMIIDFTAGIYAQSALFLIYFILALYGLWEWRNSDG